MSDSGRVGRVYDGIEESQDMSVPRRWNKQRKADCMTNHGKLSNKIWASAGSEVQSGPKYSSKLQTST